MHPPIHRSHDKNLIFHLQGRLFHSSTSELYSQNMANLLYTVVKGNKAIAIIPSGMKIKFSLGKKKDSHVLRRDGNKFCLGRMNDSQALRRDGNKILSVEKKNPTLSKRNDSYVLWDKNEIPMLSGMKMKY